MRFREHRLSKDRAQTQTLLTCAADHGLQVVITGTNHGSTRAPQSNVTSNKTMSLEHPLSCTWTLYFDATGKKKKSTSWATDMHKLGECSTIEQFWHLFNNVVSPSLLDAGNFRFFRSAIAPTWEDKANADGGRWSLVVPTTTDGGAYLDDAWKRTLVAVLGNQLDAGDAVCGVVVSVRRSEDKISVWTRDAAGDSEVLGLGRTWKALIGETPDIGISFTKHGGKQPTWSI